MSLYQNPTNYRPEIDGLRAVAVWLVILFHSQIEFLAGGFIGVDVFFVISGYLITKQIRDDMEKGEFSFGKFYLRRIRRLMPAYAVVLILSCAFAYLILLPEDLIAHVKLAGLAFLSLGNFYIANTTEGYFAKIADSIFLLHTWSLAVEEQFYIFWPALILLVRKFKPHTTLITIFILIVLLAFSEFYTKISPVSAYYLLPARLFELAIGGALPVLFHRNTPLKTTTATTLSLLGLTSIVWSALTYTSSTRFPGLNAILPCIGTAAFIYANNTRNLIGNLLALRPIVFFGKLSYSMYLWHWVIFSFFRYIYGQQASTLTLSIQLATIVLLSWLTWKFVENPFRHNWRHGLVKTTVLLIGGPTVILISSIILSKYFDGFPDRFGDNPYINALNSKPSPLYTDCHDQKKSRDCPTILLLGDSHASHFRDVINVLAIDADIVIRVNTKGGCPPLYNVTLGMFRSNNQLERDPFECRRHVNRALENMSGVDFVVLGSYWDIGNVEAEKYFLTETPYDIPSYDNNRNLLEKGLTRTLEIIEEHNAVPIIIVDTVRVPTHLENCARRKFITKYDLTCEIPIAAKFDQQNDTEVLFRKLAERFSNLIFIDPNRVLCDDGGCKMILDGVPVYRDKNHILPAASKIIGEKYLATFGNPFSLTENIQHSSSPRPDKAL